MKVREGSKLHEEKVRAGGYPLPKDRSKIYEALTEAMEGSKSQEEKVSAVAFPPRKDNNSLTLLQELEELEKTLLSRISRIAFFAKQIELTAAREVKGAQQIKERLTAQVTALESQLREKDETLQAKDSVIVSLISQEESLHARIHDLESHVAEKNGLLEIRDTEIRSLKSKLQAMVDRMERMAFLLKEAETVADIDEERDSRIAP